MNIEVFKRVIELMKAAKERHLALYKLGVDITNINEEHHEVINHLLGTLFGMEGRDTIDWWCYEKDFGTREDLKMTDLDGNEICKTIEEIHEWIEKHKGEEKEYELPKKMT